MKPAAKISSALLLLPCAAVINTWLLKAKPADKKSPPCDEKEIELCAEGMARLIRIPTETNREHTDTSAFNKLHDVMRELFPNVFSTMELFETDSNLLLRWAGKSDAPGVLFMGHQDVVPAGEDGWKHPPYAAVREGDILYGRGTLDSKCTIYSQFRAVDKLIAEGFSPPCDIYLAAGVNEESSGDGAPSIVRELQKRGVRLSLVIDECGPVLGAESLFPGMDRPFAVVGVMEKGYADVKISAKSHGGHSSTPPRKTPLARLAAFMDEVEKKRPFEKKMSPAVRMMLKKLAPSLPFSTRLLFGNLWLTEPLITWLFPKISAYGEALLKTTCCFTMCSGSDAPNVIPDEAYVIANLRTSAHQGVEDSLNVLKKLGEKYDLDFQLLEHREASSCADISGREFAYVEQCLKDCFPDCGVSPYLIMGGTDCRHFAPLTDTGLRCCPIRMTKQQVDSCHAVNENVSLSAVAECTRFYEYLIRNVCHVQN